MKSNEILLTALSNEAIALQSKAKQYRIEMEALAEDDVRFALYKEMILSLLDSSSRLSRLVIAGCNGDV